MRTLRKILSLVVAGILAFAGGPSSCYAAASSEINRPYEEVEILKGDIEKIVTRNMKRVSITDPDVADINNAKADGLELVGLAPGQTVLFIWDDTGKRTVVVRVIDEDLGFVKKRIETLLVNAGIAGVTISQNSTEGKIVLTGKVREDKLVTLGSLVAPFGGQVMNLVVKEPIEDLVQIDMQVTELNSTLDKEFGVLWGADTAGKGTVGYAEKEPLTTVIPRQSGSFQDLFKVGEFSRTPQLLAQINMLISKNKGKVLSKPRLVVISGKEATVLVGGEIPVKTTTVNATGGQSQENVTYKAYGLSMAITPTITENRKVTVLLSFENSSPDSTTLDATTSMSTTSAQTELMLDDRQTIVLAGMIKSTKSDIVTRVPFLSAIPVIGYLFRHTSRPDTQKELVISITATILRSSKSAALTQASDKPATVVQESAGTRSTAAVEAYAVSIQEKIGSAIAYPYEAQEKGWHGTVKLELVVQKDGTLKKSVVKESSGYAVFDQDALNTAQVLAPYAPFSDDLAHAELTLTIPIVYSLDAFFKNVGSQNN